VASIYNLLKLLAKLVTFGLASLARYRGDRAAINVPEEVSSQRH
jgi:hypothetical protein